MVRQRHLSILPLLLAWVGASACLHSKASAFSVRSNLGRRRKLLFDLHLHPSALTNNDGAFLSQLTQHHMNDNERTKDFYAGGFLHRCHMLLVTCITSAVIIFPHPSVASVQQTSYPELDHSGGWSSISVAITAEDLSTLTPSSVTELGLKPATEDKPQITLKGRDAYGQPSQQTMAPKRNARKPILQGLVYFPEQAPTDPAAKIPSGPQLKQALDYYSDVLVLTAVSATQPDGPILAGAKFPVSSVRFPFSFQMFKENLLTSRPGVLGAWEGVSDAGDVILRADICPSDASSFPCDDKESKKHAAGVAKLITNLPGLKEGESVRAPASLALQ